MSKTCVSISELTECCLKILHGAGVPEQDADLLTDTLLDAEICGIESHGLIRLPAYIRRIRQGLISPVPEITVSERDCALSIDGGDGLGQVVARRAMQECVAGAKKHGVCFAAVRNSNHFGAASYFSRMAAREECIGFACTSAGPAMAPFGGMEPLLGTDPFAVSFPVKGHAPFTLDIAVSAVAKGKIRIFEREGKCLPRGWALNKYGNDTTDPAAAIFGSLLPMAGHKGYGIAMVIEAFCCLLSGARLSCESEGMFDSHGKAGTGHFFGAFDIAHFTDPEQFERRGGEWFEKIKNSRTRSGVKQILIPGELEESRRNGGPDSLLLSEATYSKILDLNKDGQ